MHVLVGLLSNVMSFDGKYGNNNKEGGKRGRSCGCSVAYVVDGMNKRMSAGFNISSLANQHQANLKHAQEFLGAKYLRYEQGP